MTAHAVAHATFSLERTFDASPVRVFKAFADPEMKSQWFSGPPGWNSDRQSVDFLVGGREHVVTTATDGTRHTFDCTYQDIVPNERIIYTYDMLLGGKRISVSLATIELRPAGKGTHLVLTEMGAFLDGPADATSRETGTKGLLDKLAASLS